jgi:hypothetical protein
VLRGLIQKRCKRRVAAHHLEEFVGSRSDRIVTGEAGIEVKIDRRFVQWLT